MRSRRPDRRFYYGRIIDGEREATIELSPDESHHLLRVLRLGAGDAIDVFDAAGRGYDGEVAGKERGIARIALKAAHEPIPAQPEVNIAVAVLKRRAMDLLVEKLSELGVDHVQPLITDFCVAQGDIKEKDDPPGRWERVAIAAAKQCRRNRPLAILPAEKLESWLKSVPAPANAAFAHFETGAPTLGEWLRRRGQPEAATWIAIGPEGGWSEDEAKIFAENGWAGVRLGELVLRAETATIAAAAACRLL